MLSSIHLLDRVIAPALEKIGLWSRAAEELVLGTAIIESGLTYLKQHGDGPALGLWQVEPATHDDLYTNFLNYRPELGSILMELRAPRQGHCYGYTGRGGRRRHRVTGRQRVAEAAPDNRSPREYNGILRKNAERLFIL